MGILAHGLISCKPKLVMPLRQSNAAGEWNLRPWSIFPPTKRRGGWLASPEETAFARADGKVFLGSLSCFLRPMRAKSLQKNRAAGEIFAGSQKRDDQETRTLTVFISWSSLVRMPITTNGCLGS
jgi:hypothetical protein